MLLLTFEIDKQVIVSRLFVNIPILRKQEKLYIIHFLLQ